MTHCHRILLLASLMLPVPAYAATYKCVGDGKTTYQQRPCDGNAAQREIETGPPRAVPRVRSVPATEAAAAVPANAAPNAEASGAAPPKVALDGAGREALAREAFGALKRRDFDRFGALLCASAKQKYSRPDTKDTLPLAARGFAARGTELGEVLANEPKYVHFAVSEKAADASPLVRVAADRAFSVGLDRDAAGRTCVDGFGTVFRGTR
jgi:hypothetical protein